VVCASDFLRLVVSVWLYEQLPITHSVGLESLRRQPTCKQRLENPERDQRGCAHKVWTGAGCMNVIPADGLVYDS
jgi:hypothetical protein